MNRSNPLRPMIIVFIMVNGFLVAAKTMFSRWGIDRDIVIFGNVVLFFLSVCAVLLSRRAMKAENPNVFVRVMYINFMIKLAVCIAAVFIYIRMEKPDINKPALFVCMGLYALYTIMEVATLTKLLRKKKNA